MRNRVQTTITNAQVKVEFSFVKWQILKKQLTIKTTI